MVQRTLRRSAVTLLLFALTLPLFACEGTERVALLIPGFEEQDVQGIWMWKLSDETGEYERFAEIRFGEVQEYGAGVRWIEYTQSRVDGPLSLTFPAALLDDTGGVQLELLLVLGDAPGLYKASSFNEAGESELSTQTLEVGATG
ncbi:MAG: hypothetical protein MJE66_19540 [Proteobacteria bacterium]|nr:hypothetical protein [Pseudomonadota bacterium]